jgi:hypothetical protein
VQVLGQIQQRDIIVAIDATQVKPDELVNDIQFAQYAVPTDVRSGAAFEQQWNLNNASYDPYNSGHGSAYPLNYKVPEPSNGMSKQLRQIIPSLNPNPANQ